MLLIPGFSTPKCLSPLLHGVLVLLSLPGSHSPCLMGCEHWQGKGNGGALLPARRPLRVWARLEEAAGSGVPGGRAIRRYKWDPDGWCWRSRGWGQSCSSHAVPPPAMGDVSALCGFPFLRSPHWFQNTSPRYNWEEIRIKPGKKSPVGLQALTNHASWSGRAGLGCLQEPGRAKDHTKLHRAPAKCLLGMLEAAESSASPSEQLQTSAQGEECLFSM